MTELNEKQLLAFLTSEDDDKIDKAIKYLFEQGTKSLDFLQNLEGHKEFCISNLLGYAQWWCTAPIPREYRPLGYPESLTEEEKEKSITVEVVSLYLISAIYYGSLDFTGRPFLIDLNLPQNKPRRGNKDEYIVRGFYSARKWSQKCQEMGLEALREQEEYPLESENLFWC
ncbi:MAG: hypothetical protein DRR16_29095 [Candidatus Parabeggiatoa sp. nov. 3]|nr:MAG: hypothetical protein DRR00_30530 [Gammaproteobacteria bacterium]RKZ77731.1 MAG: hypothetical protein DRR16_29095 [Gammaproteobacteria bacterium]